MKMKKIKKRMTKEKKLELRTKARQFLLLLLYEEEYLKRASLSAQKIFELYVNEEELYEALKVLGENAFLKLKQNCRSTTSWRSYIITKEGREEVEKFLSSPKFLKKFRMTNKKLGYRN
jgi:hypothetical protein